MLITAPALLSLPVTVLPVPGKQQQGPDWRPILGRS